MPTAPQMNKILDRVNFPADKVELVTLAERLEADAEVMDTLRELPDVRYRSMLDVFNAAGVPTEPVPPYPQTQIAPLPSDRHILDEVRKGRREPD